MNESHLKFISELQLHGDMKKAYCAAYPNANPGTANKSATRLLQRADIAEAMKDNSPEVIVPEQAQKDLFVKEYMRHGDAGKAFQAIFPGRADYKSQGLKMVQNPYVRNKITEYRKRADRLFVRELKTEQELTLFTYAEKRDLFRRIALGLVLFEKNVNIDGTWQMQPVAPDINDRLRAIDIDNRMSGEYAPEKLQTQQQVKGFVIHIKGEGWNERL